MTTCDVVYWHFAEMTNPAGHVRFRGQSGHWADLTIISGFDVDITTAIPNGAEVEIDPQTSRPFIRVL
jgi:hypothetical protein